MNETIPSAMMPGTLAPTSGVQGKPSAERSDGECASARVISASTLEGDKVVNRAGEKLGTIEDIMLDVPGGRIAYAVLSAGGFLGIGNRLFAVPWHTLTLDPERNCFVLDPTKEWTEETIA